MHRAQRGMAQCHAVLAPHQDKLETEAGVVALFVVAGVAALVHSGAESPAALVDAIKVAAAMTGVPEEAFEAHARFTTLLLQGSELTLPIPAQRWPQGL